jgi:hypothetical protein
MPRPVMTSPHKNKFTWSCIFTTAFWLAEKSFRPFDDVSHVDSLGEEHARTRGSQKVCQRSKPATTISTACSGVRPCAIKVSSCF